MRVRTRDALAGLLPPGPGRILFLVGDGVFVQIRGNPPQRIGPLFDHIRALAGTDSLPAQPLAGVLGEARSHARQLPELQFVIGELLPLLRSLVRNASGAVTEPPNLARDLRQLKEWGEDLLRALGGIDSGLDAATLPPKDRVALLRLLGLPCALAGTAVIPLEPVRRSQQGDLEVVLDRQQYRYRLEASRPLASFLQAINRTAVWNVRRAAVRDPILKRRAADFLRLVRAVLSSCGMEGPELRFALPQGLQLELQHRRGFWVLVCGPAPPRASRGAPLFVGLPIRGRTRKERLATPPVAAPTAGGFFTPSGEPKRGGICMGPPEQYRRLHSESFTDAEAVLFWLDAALIVATGRSAFHDRWRSERQLRQALRPRSTPSGDRHVNETGRRRAALRRRSAREMFRGRGHLG